MKFAYVLAATAVFASGSASASDITGFRVEALLGWDSSKFSDLGSHSGFAYGAGIGYDFAVAPTVSLGVDGEIGSSTAKFRVSSGSEFVELKNGRDLYVGARVTGKVAEKFAVYAKGGYANGRLNASYNFDGDRDSFGENGGGFRLGAGGQYLVGEKAYVGAEYRYTSYQDSFSRHQVLATFGYRF